MQEIQTNGLTNKEFEIGFHLTEAWNLYLQLDNLNQYDTADFMVAIHNMERILAIRHMRRNFPNYWK